MTSRQQDDELRRERIRQYREKAERERASAERATDSKEREQHLALAVGWERLEALEHRHVWFEALVKDGRERLTGDQLPPQPTKK
jgi:hypothetical protein